MGLAERVQSNCISPASWAGDANGPCGTPLAEYLSRKLNLYGLWNQGLTVIPLKKAARLQADFTGLILWKQPTENYEGASLPKPQPPFRHRMSFRAPFDGSTSIPVPSTMPQRIRP